MGEVNEQVLRRLIRAAEEVAFPRWGPKQDDG